MKFQNQILIEMVNSNQLNLQVCIFWCQTLLIFLHCFFSEWMITERIRKFFLKCQLNYIDHFQSCLMYLKIELLQDWFFCLIECDEKQRFFPKICIQLISIRMISFPCFVEGSYATSVGLLKTFKGAMTKWLQFIRKINSSRISMSFILV